MSINNVFVDFTNLDGLPSLKGRVDIYNCTECGTQTVFDGEVARHTGTGILPSNCTIGVKS